MNVLSPLRWKASRGGQFTRRTPFATRRVAVWRPGALADTTAPHPAPGPRADGSSLHQINSLGANGGRHKRADIRPILENGRHGKTTKYYPRLSERGIMLYLNHSERALCASSRHTMSLWEHCKRTLGLTARHLNMLMWWSREGSLFRRRFPHTTRDILMSLCRTLIYSTI